MRLSSLSNVALASTLLLSVPTVALAQTPSHYPPPGVAPVVAASAAPAQPRTLDEGQEADPNIDRGMLMPTGQTQPAGTLTMSDYEIVMVGLTYGITDRLQIGVVAPLLGGALSGSLKWQFLRHSRLRLSVLAGAAVHPVEKERLEYGTSMFSGSSELTATADPFAGVAGSLCLDDGCHSLLSASGHVAPPLAKGDGTVAVYSASLVGRVSSRAKLVLEYSQGWYFGKSSFSLPVVGAALRVHNGKYAGELGGMALILADEHTAAVPLMYVSGSVRFGQ